MWFEHGEGTLWGGEEGLWPSTRLAGKMVATSQEPNFPVLCDCPPAPASSPLSVPPQPPQPPTLMFLPLPASWPLLHWALPTLALIPLCLPTGDHHAESIYVCVPQLAFQILSPRGTLLALKVNFVNCCWLLLCHYYNFTRYHIRE